MSSVSLGAAPTADCPDRADADAALVTVCFSVQAVAEPGVMPRVLELFAKRGLVPQKWHSTVSGTALAIDVQAGGPAYPVRFKSTGGASPFLPSTNPACSNINSSTGSGTILFDNWGTTTTVTPPPSALDFSSLGG